MAVSFLTKVALGKEGSWAGGTAGPGTSPTILIPIRPTSFTESFDAVLDDGMRGLAAKDYKSYAGATRVEGSLEGPWYPEECGHYLMGILGADAGGTSHVFTLATSTPSYSIEFNDPVQAIRYVGMKVNTFTLRFSAAEGFLNWTAGFLGRNGQTGTTLAASAFPADATRQPIRGWESRATAAGAENFNLMEAEITMNREVSLVWTAQNSRYAYIAYHGPLEVTARATFDYSGTTELTWNRNETQGNLVLSFSQSSNNMLVMSMASVAFADGPYEIDRSGIHTTIALQGRALYYSTDSGPIKVTLTNSSATGY
jgi:hypothetical protein